MNDFFPILLVTAAGAVLVAASSAGLSRRERKWVTVSFFMHVGFACAQVPIALSFYGGSDMEEPFLVFCVVFVITFGIAVGLTSTNLGTLSRYRSPILPFFAVLLLVLGRTRRARFLAKEVRGGPERVLGAA
jgi:hypothetical protein